MLKDPEEVASVGNYNFYDDLINLKMIPTGCGTAVTTSPVGADGWAAIDQFAEFFARHKSLTSFPQTWDELQNNIYGVDIRTGNAIEVSRQIEPAAGRRVCPAEDRLPGLLRGQVEDGVRRWLVVASSTAMPDVVATDQTERRPPGDEPGAGAGAKRAGVPAWQQFIAKYGVLVALVVTIIVFSALKPHVFPTGSNLKAILEQFSPLAIIAFGLTVVLVMGDFDLSVAGMSASEARSSIALMSKTGQLPPAILIGLLGRCRRRRRERSARRVRGGASSFIITLAMGQVFNGFEYSDHQAGDDLPRASRARRQIATGTFLGL